MPTSFKIPFVTANPNSWGPPSEIDESNTDAGLVAKYAALPYSPFGRNDRLGRVADFTSGNKFMAGRYNRRTQHASEEDEEQAFQLVDTTKAQQSHKRFVNPASKRRMHSQRLRQINARRQQATGHQLDKMTRGAPAGRFGGRGAGRGGRGAGRGAGTFNNRNVDRQPSVAVQSDWVKVEELDLQKINKHLVIPSSIPTPEDVLWCGFVDTYNDSYDKVSARQPINLKRMENKLFYPVTTTDDPVLEKFAIDEAAQVFVTDTIMSHLMCSTRSVYPWDIVVQKLPNGTLFLDKRDNSQFDYLTVHETAYATPSPSEDEGINSSGRLSLESTMVCQNFSQQILKKSGRKQMDLPNPFYDEEDAEEVMEPASVAYRYRKWQLDDGTRVMCRTELHGLVKNTQYMTAFALNEYPAGSWRDKIDAQRGAVLATELKNNSFKLAKWTTQSLLAGADQMKIGFVARAAPKNPYEHQILATQFYRPKDFAQQITLNEGNMWAMFRLFVNMFQKLETGKYVLMRDPNKPILHLYRVPPNTFEDDEEDEEEEEKEE
jgi:translation initiation factor 3 subunit D